MMTLLKNIKELVQVRTEPVSFIAGVQMKELPTIKNAFLLIDEGRIKDQNHFTNLVRFTYSFGLCRK